jgi:hypothetical protein
MNMPEKLYNTLKEKLGEEKVSLDGKEIKILDLIAGDEGLWKLSKDVLQKVKDANADLTKQREEWEKKEKEYKATISNTEKEVEKIKAGQLTEDERKQWLKIKEKGMTQDVEVKFNTQADQIKTLTDTVTNLTKGIETERTERANAKRESAEQKMRSDVLLELGKHKIEGDGADLAFTHLNAKGYARLSEKEGSFIPQYRLVKDGKELESDLPSMVKSIAESDMGKRLATGTKGGGTGSDHQSHSAAGDKRPGARSMLEMRGDESYDNTK